MFPSTQKVVKFLQAMQKFLISKMIQVSTFPKHTKIFKKTFYQVKTM